MLFKKVLGYSHGGDRHAKPSGVPILDVEIKQFNFVLCVVVVEKATDRDLN